jgi:hypothetical protein
VSESEKELKRCLNSFHIDYFLYKIGLEQFVSFLSLLTNSPERIQQVLADTKTSRAFDAFLILASDKLKPSSNEASIERLKDCLNKLGDYFVENFDSILDNQSGIFAMRSFLKVIGGPDLLEQNVHSTNNNQSNKKRKGVNEFRLKNLEIKVLPNEWELDTYIKKFYKNIKDKNILGRRFLD